MNYEQGAMSNERRGTKQKARPQRRSVWAIPARRDRASGPVFIYGVRELVEIENGKRDACAGREPAVPGILSVDGRCAISGQVFSCLENDVFLQRF